MSNKIFTPEQMNELSTNKYVKNVTEKGITYTDEFKELYILQNSNGKSSVEIFEDVGFEIEMIGRVRIISCGKRWRKAYKEKGDTGIIDARGTSGNGGRPST